MAKQLKAHHVLIFFENHVISISFNTFCDVLFSMQFFWNRGLLIKTKYCDFGL